MKLARLANELGEGPSARALDALAAAHAASGHPQQAVEISEAAQRAAAADPTVDAQLEAEMRERLRRYRDALGTP